MKLKGVILFSWIFLLNLGLMLLSMGYAIQKNFHPINWFIFLSVGSFMALIAGFYEKLRIVLFLEVCLVLVIFVNELIHGPTINIISLVLVFIGTLIDLKDIRRI